MGKKDRGLNIHYSCIHIVYWFVMAAATLYVVPLLRVKGLTETQIGIVLAIKYLSASLSQVLISYFADKYNQIFTLKRILVGLCFFSIPMTIAFYVLPPSFGLAVFTFIVFGGSINGATAYINAIATRFTDAGRKIQYSYARGLGSIGWGIASIAISYIVDATFVEVILLIQIVMLVVMVLVIITLPAIPDKKDVREIPEKAHSYGYLFTHNIGFVFFLLASTLLFIGYTLQTTFLIDIVNHVGGGNVELGYVELIQSICELLPAVIYVIIAKKLSTYSILRVSAISCFMMVFCVMLSQNVGHLMALQVFDILGYGIYWTVSVEYIYKTVDKNDWVKGQALVSVCSLGIGGIIGTLFGGAIMEALGITGLLAMSSVMAGIGVVMMLLGMRLSEKPQTRRKVDYVTG